jgi:hypothetical protein
MSLRLITLKKAMRFRSWPPIAADPLTDEAAALGGQAPRSRMSIQPPLTGHLMKCGKGRLAFAAPLAE